MGEKWKDGVWLGIKPESNEIYIGTAEGVRLARSVRRKPEGIRWVKDEILGIRGTPWEPVPEEFLPQPQGAGPEVEPKDPNDDIGPPVRRDFMIMKSDVEAAGMTEGCRGCRAIRLGHRGQDHSAACRRRIEDHLQTTAEGPAKLQRRDRRIERLVTSERTLGRPTSTEAGAGGTAEKRSLGQDDPHLERGRHPSHETRSATRGPRGWASAPT